MGTALAVAVAGTAWSRPAEAEPAGPVVAVERVAGGDRVATAAAAARRGWPGGAPVVVLAGAADPRDAVTAAGLAVRSGAAPVLLTPPEGLTDELRSELARLRPARAYLIGGEDALAPAVAAGALEHVADVVRVAGPDAAATAAAVAALTTAPPATPGTVAAPPATPDTAAAPAGPLPLPIAAEPLAAAVTGLLAPGSPDPAGSSVAAADQAVAGGADPHGVVLAPAAGWADAVVAAPLAAALGRPLLLTDPVVLPAPVADFLRRAGPTSAVLVGGERALDPLLAAAVADGGAVGPWSVGRAGPAVAAIQRRLADAGFHPATTGGTFDAQTRAAVHALQKAFGLPVTGVVGEAEVRRLAAGTRPPVLRPDVTASHGDHVEISLSRQLLQVVRGGVVQVAVHTSTGKASTPTVQGLFRVLDHRPGFNALGMYLAMHFFRGYAIHGYDPVPLYPASHGCARVTYRDAELLHRIVPNGMPVVVWRG